MIILPCIPEEVFILVANMITLFTFRFSYLQCCCWYFLCSLHCEFCQPLLSWWFDFFFHYYLQYFISKIRLCPLINYVHHSKYWIPKAHLLVAAYYLWVLVEVSSTSCYFMNTWLRYQLIEMKCSAKYMPNVPVSWNISCDEPSVIVIKLAVIEKLLKII